MRLFILASFLPKVLTYLKRITRCSTHFNHVRLFLNTPDGYSALVKNVLSVLVSYDADIYRHLATEEWLLQNTCEDRSFLFFWTNAPAVVIGKNQNPWREVRISALSQENSRLARRISGGGAVFHDAGNLNISFVLPRASYNRDTVFRVFQKALAQLGVSSHFMGPTGLGSDGRKISGHAFAFRGHAVLHHATLLLATDFDKMRRLLRTEPSDIQTHAILSNPADVANLRDFVSDLQMQDVVSAIEHAAQSILGCDIQKQEPWAPATLSDIHQRSLKFSSWEWIYGHTPPFEIHIRIEPPTARWQADLHIEHGIVVQGGVSFPESRPPSVSLTGLRFMPKELIAQLTSAGLEHLFASEIVERLLTA